MRIESIDRLSRELFERTVSDPDSEEALTQGFAGLAGAASTAAIHLFEAEDIHEGERSEWQAVGLLLLSMADLCSGAADASRSEVIRRARCLASEMEANDIFGARVVERNFED